MSVTHRFNRAAARAPLGRERAHVDLADRAPKLTLAGTDLAQLAGEAARPLGERRLEPCRRRCGDPQRLVEARGAGREPLQLRRFGATQVPEMSDRRERGGGRLRALARRSRVRGRVGRAGSQSRDLVVELAAAGVQLEQDRLRRLAREPELAALRVPADAVGRDRRNRRREQLLLRHDRQVDKIARIAPDQHEQRTEAGAHRLDDELEPACGRVGDNC